MVICKHNLQVYATGTARNTAASTARNRMRQYPVPRNRMPHQYRNSELKHCSVTVKIVKKNVYLYLVDIANVNRK